MNDEEFIDLKHLNFQSKGPTNAGLLRGSERLKTQNIDLFEDRVSTIPMLDHDFLFFKFTYLGLQFPFSDTPK